MKRISVFLLIAVMFIFSACGNKSYRDDVSCETLINAILSDNEKDFSEYDSDFTRYVTDDEELYSDCKIIYSTEVNDIDEIGVFKSENQFLANELKDELLDYIEEMRETQTAFIKSYAPEELQKLNGARVVSFENYVIYIISDTDSMNKTISAIENALA